MRMLRLLFITSIVWCGLLVCLEFDAYAAASSATSGTQSTVSNMREDLHAIQTFNKLREDQTGVLKVEAQKKHKILFIMGVCLLVGILTTAGLGLAMVLGDKQLFMWHMAVAGVTVTLAIAHAVTSIVWFFPF